jgi:hypothetical protein
MPLDVYIGLIVTESPAHTVESFTNIFSIALLVPTTTTVDVEAEVASVATIVYVIADKLLTQVKELGVVVPSIFIK